MQAEKTPKDFEQIARQGFSEEDIACIPDVKSSTSGIPDVIGRYYYQYVTPNGEQFLYLHTNHICVVGLGKEHPILKEGKTVKSVSFKGDKFDYTQIEVVGRSKKGGFWTDPTTQICTITCEDGTEYPYFSMIRARLIEVNLRLQNEPSLLTSKPSLEGYIAILQPKYNEYESVAASLIKTQDPKVPLKENL